MRHPLSSFPFLLLGVTLAVSLGGCDTTPQHPDYRVKLVPNASKTQALAIPPECVSWSDANSPFENHRMPQLGCAQARNLAAQVERPEDLIEPHKLGSGDAVLAASSIQNYRAGKARALMDAKSEAPIAQASTGTGSTP
ncbi:MAG: CpaD family pilus assembly lipoprotein [Bdellovibrionales bacterium]